MVFLVALGELAVRPMLEDVAGYLPPDFAPSRQGLALGVKALAPLPLITFFAAGLAGAYGSIGTKGIARLSIGLGVGLATIAIATVIYLIVNRSVLAPIDDLIAATHRVRAGDVRTRIPLLSADELGDLVQSFNEMLDGLSERESLRDELVSQAEELRASRERIVAAADEERRRVERDLHDGAQQQLVLLRLKLGQLERDPGRRELIAEIRDDVERALAELRDLAHGLYPQALEAVGLRGALREAADRAPIAVTIDCDGTGRYRPELEAAVYFCCLEALQNAAKHAGEDARAAVTLAEDGGALKFEVSDDGRGFDAQETGGAGLQNMTDRIGALGGELKIASTPGTGTRVAGVIPLES
jgi:signal transduction histidine kinase